jgi:hypothetical protein
MLVALPSAIAFGVTIFSPLGAGNVAQGALAGILGATVLGLIAPAFGGTDRLITAPCAPPRRCWWRWPSTSPGRASAPRRACCC